MKNVVYAIRTLVLVYALFLFSGTAGAVLWEDRFEEVASEDWEQIGEDSIWTVEDGFLRADIQAQTAWRTIFERYQFIAYPGPYNDFTITVETVGASYARFGIALAKYFRNPITEVEEYGYYLFFTNDVQVARDSGVFPGPGKRWNTEALQQMELRFKDGRFQFNADGEPRLDFTDANFDQIDTIAFVLVGFVTEELSLGGGWVNTFTIEGLTVSPRRKLATLWGHLKK